MKNLRKMRKAAGLNQSDLANLSGLTQSKISKIENEKCSTDVDDAARIARALDCSVDDLIREPV